MMFLLGNASQERLSLYRDVLAAYKKIISVGLETYGIDPTSVEIKNGVKKNLNRAPLIIIERGSLQHEPRSLMLSERVIQNQNTNEFESHTSHMIEYPIEFMCYGNSYLEAEKLGGLAMEAILTTGMSIISGMHPNIIGAEFVGWGKSELAESKDSSLISCTVLGKVFLQIDGYYSIQN
jgi:hypothetical protein